MVVIRINVQSPHFRQLDNRRRAAHSSNLHGFGQVEIVCDRNKHPELLDRLWTS